MTGLPKSGDQLLKLVLGDIKMMEDEYGVKVISWTTDDGPDGKRMRRLLVLKQPKIIGTLCWGHQINLVFGEYISLPGVKEWIESALEIIKWFNNHSTALDLLYKEQILSQLEHVLALLVPVVTRWTSHYLSICRLLKVSSPLRTVVVRMEDRLRVAAGSKREQVEKAESIIAMVRNDALWLALTRYSFLSHSLSPPGHSHDFSQN